MSDFVVVFLWVRIVKKHFAVVGGTSQEASRLPFAAKSWIKIMLIKFVIV